MNFYRPLIAYYAGTLLAGTAAIYVWAFHFARPDSGWKFRAPEAVFWFNFKNLLILAAIPAVIFAAAMFLMWWIGRSQSPSCLATRTFVAGALAMLACIGVRMLTENGAALVSTWLAAPLVAALLIGRPRSARRTASLLACLLPFALSTTTHADDWPRWRGPTGNAISAETNLPSRWDKTTNVAWSVAVPGEGASSPIVVGQRVFLTSAREAGGVRIIHCFDRDSGKTLWTREIKDDFPEITLPLTGHAAATPASDGERVVAFFGNAGAVCWDLDGKELWRRDLGDFETELGLATSPIIEDGRVILVCDHDGDRIKTFDSFLIALDAKTGKTIWKTDRPGLFRSWSTPIIVPVLDATGEESEPRREIVVSAQDEVRGYDFATGRELWKVGGMTGWVTPSPALGDGLIFAASGRDGPTLAVRPGGRGDVTATHVFWKENRGAPYVCSPLFHDRLLYVHNEAGILTCFEAATGKIVYRERLDGKFSASAVAGDGKLYVSNEAGDTFVIRAGRRFELLSKNSLGEEVLASPAVSAGRLYLRTRTRLHAIGDAEGDAEGDAVGDAVGDASGDRAAEGK
ncbi:MAG: PQQ-binding-like beta-propeller repeat protein [Planctomycetaceae bacterium]